MEMPSSSSRSDSRRPASPESCRSQHPSTYPLSSVRSPQRQVQYSECEQDLSPSTADYPRTSVETYLSHASQENSASEREDQGTRDQDYDYIPPLPAYRYELSLLPNVRPSTPKEFAQLFPSMNRLSIRHDDLSTDGNLNLRVDTVAPRTRTAVQLFHLRMYDLARRDFSLRRYCRHSCREVCHSKRHYLDPALTRPTIQRSVSSAVRAMTRPQFKRHTSSTSFSSKDRRPETPHSHDARASGPASPLTSSASVTANAAEPSKRPPPPSQPTNIIKLDFSNYARVEVQRKGQKAKHNKRYGFQWWGHNYAWKRVVEKHLCGVVSFHLIRDGQPTPIAHVVPETRSPTQVEADELAGCWVPPCYMWINDQSVIEAVTDVADVIVATGLIALVDDCIKERWHHRKFLHVPVLGNVEYVGPRAFVQRVFSQRSDKSSDPHDEESQQQHEYDPQSSLAYTCAIPAY